MPAAVLRSALASGLREAARCKRIVSLMAAATVAADDAEEASSIEVEDEPAAAKSLARFKERAKQADKEAKQAEKEAKKANKVNSEDERKKVGACFIDCRCSWRIFTNCFFNSCVVFRSSNLDLYQPNLICPAPVNV